MDQNDIFNESHPSRCLVCQTFATVTQSAANSEMSFNFHRVLFKCTPKTEIAIKGKHMGLARGCHLLF